LIHTENWDVTVHVYNNRAEYGYGIAIVTDEDGNEVYRFNVRAGGLQYEFVRIGAKVKQLNNCRNTIVYDIF
jgi:hypothetical protein